MVGAESGCDHVVVGGVKAIVTRRMTIRIPGVLMERLKRYAQCRETETTKVSRNQVVIAALTRWLNEEETKTQ